MSKSDKHVLSSVKEAAKTNSLYAGSISRIKIVNLLGIENGKLITIKNLHSPALITTYKEIIDNASDIALKPSNKTDLIKVDFKNGVCCVYNNGKHFTHNYYKDEDGNNIKILKDYSRKVGGPKIADKEDVRIIEMVLNTFNAGSNVNKSEENLACGLNAYGSKLSAVHAEWFIVESQSKVKTYQQISRNRIDVVEEPVISEEAKDLNSLFKVEIPVVPDRSQTHTFIAFKPLYKQVFGYDDPELMKELESIIRFRCYQLKVYQPNVKVVFNDEEINVNGLKDLAEILYPSQQYFDIKVSSGNLIKLGLVITDKKINAKHFTIANGAYSIAGSHIDFFKSQLSEQIEKILKKHLKSEKINMSETLGLVKFMIVMSNSKIQWTDQTKTTVQCSEELFSDFKLNKKDTELFITTLTNKLLLKSVDKTPAAKIKNDKLILCPNAGRKLKEHSSIFFVEGESASAFLKALLSKNNSKGNKLPPGSPSDQWWSLISLMGVMPNMFNASKEMEIDGEFVNLLSEKARTNQRFLKLMQATGLKYNTVYNDTSTLTHGSIVFATDGDSDGNHICSILLVWLWLFWPNLFELGYIKRLVLPLIIVNITRVKTKGKYKKGDVIDFQSEILFDEWSEKNCNRYEYTVDYNKGLGSYDSDTITRFSNPERFEKAIYTYKIEDAVLAKTTFDMFFNSKKAKLRKELLKTPVKFLSKEEILDYNQQQIINVEKVHFMIDNKSYSLELISRQLVNLIDGLNECKRKIIYAALKKFGHDNTKLKTYVFAGIVASTALYMHGDGSLTNSLSLMCQKFETAYMYAFLEGIGSFGNRNDSTYASARYTQCRLSKITKLIFNPLDTYVLDYKLTENERAEPVNFVPIFPMAILENYNNVSFGYKNLSYRRNLKVVYDIILDRLNETNELIYDEIPICRKYNKGKIEVINDIEFSYGVYELKKSKPKMEQYDIITITELPIAVESDSYRLDLINHKVKGEFIERVERNNTETEVNMDVILKKDSYTKIIDKFGDITTFLGLKKSLHSNLSYYHDNGFGHVVVCDKYIDVIDHWYKARSELYAKRINRELIISNLRIIRLENIIRYIEFAKENKIQEMESDELATLFLLDNKFISIDDSLLSNPEFTPVGQIEELIMKGPKSSMNYLLSLQQRQLTINSLNKFVKSLEGEKNNNNELTSYLSESPPGKTVWLKEMEAAYKAMTS